MWFWSTARCGLYSSAAEGDGYAEGYAPGRAPVRQSVDALSSASARFSQGGIAPIPRAPARSGHRQTTPVLAHKATRMDVHREHLVDFLKLALRHRDPAVRRWMMSTLE